ncbi:MAG: hypothetical protein CVT66_11225 [Actinobacteria bacterium HGW-Actinobacteria-6]|nr:MAG: hypothetical protein CVT66_11225 [Actinobacteria bacterium HGW-Actinobacteria-6]
MFKMLTVFGWFVVGVVAVILLAAVVFILGFLLSMIVSIIHGFGLGVEHVVERNMPHSVGHHTGRVALHH